MQLHLMITSNAITWYSWINIVNKITYVFLAYHTITHLPDNSYPVLNVKLVDAL